MQLGTHSPEYFHVLKVSGDVVIGGDQMAGLQSLFEVQTTDDGQEQEKAIGERNEGAAEGVEKEGPKMGAEEAM